MKGLLEKLLARLASLLPKQKNSGRGNAQIGHNRGDVRVYNIHNHHAARRQDAEDRRRANPRQRKVLDLIPRGSEHREVVLDFVWREFGTRMIVDIDDHESLFRIRRYAEKVIKNGVFKN